MTWIDALEATIDKGRIGTHWEDCYLEHKDCAILRLIDYAVQLECENKALSVNAENLEIVRKQRGRGPRHCLQAAGVGKDIMATAVPHSWHGRR